jgi:uridine phosphorylase
MGTITPTDLILNPDGSIYHLHLRPDDVSDTIILVGDPERAGQVAARFDTVDVEKENREFVTRSGTLRGKRLSVISTGIGTDNIDIVLNELDALCNIDLVSRQAKPARKRLELIRIGTSGSIQQDISPGSFIVTEIAGGYDGLYHFYRDDGQRNIRALSEAFMKHAGWNRALPEPYFIRASEKLSTLMTEDGWYRGITISTPGFYAPQCRRLRLSPAKPDLLEKTGTFRYGGLRVNNYEMESSALYALAAMMGHEAITICAGIANRVTNKFMKEYKGIVGILIDKVLDKLTIYDRPGSKGT